MSYSNEIMATSMLLMIVYMVITLTILISFFVIVYNTGKIKKLLAEILKEIKDSSDPTMQKVKKHDHLNQ